MLARVQKWGNSLALRIPKPIAAGLGLENDGSVELSVEEGRLVVTPIAAPAYTLEQLLSGVTDDNRHGEADVGPAVGAEAW